MKNIVISHEKGSTKAHITSVEDWEGFDLLVKYLISSHNAKVIDKIDGPESRIWSFNIGAVEVQLKNNPYGNYLQINTLKRNPLFESIISDLDIRLGN